MTAPITVVASPIDVSMRSTSDAEDRVAAGSTEVVGVVSFTGCSSLSVVRRP
jgi:hypothetical protein